MNTETTELNQVFPYGDQIVRVHGTPEDPLFVAADICRCLEMTNPSKALSGLDEDEKGLTKGYTLGGEQNLLAVNRESIP